MENNMELTPVDVAVIGAGITGLSTAVHARLSELSVRVFEKHSIPGGLCTAWKRHGYVFDYCYEYFVGNGKHHGFYGMCKDLGVIDGREFKHLDSFGRYVGSDGQVLNLYTDYRRLQEHMLQIAPEDTGKIKELCKAIKRMRSFVMSEFSLSPAGLSKLLRSFFSLPTMMKWSHIFVRQWCSELRNPFLKEALPILIGWTDFPMAGVIMVFGGMAVDNVGYPLGGSLPVALAMENRAKSLGAEFVYSTGVKRIIFENGNAIGIELENGKIQFARHVVSAVDAFATFNQLLEGKVKDATYEAMFKKQETSLSLIQVSLGVRYDLAWELKTIPDKIFLPLSKPITVDGRKRSFIRIHHYANDPYMAPEGGAVFIVQWDGDYDRWKNLLTDRNAYKTEKTRVLAETVSALEEHFPGITERIEASDVATPTSCERYTDNWRGCMQAWVTTPELWKSSVSGAGLPKSFPGLNHFHMIGHWTEAASGTPPAARNGRDVVRVIMKSEGKKAAR